MGFECRRGGGFLGEYRDDSGLAGAFFIGANGCCERLGDVGRGDRMAGSDFCGRSGGLWTHCGTAMPEGQKVSQTALDRAKARCHIGVGVPGFYRDQDPPDLGPQSNASRASTITMNSLERDEMPAEIDFSKGIRGLRHIPPDAMVLMPVSIERGVWEYFSGKAEQRGVDLSELVTEVLKRDIEINEALK
jgi:hypothetical protein